MLTNFEVKKHILDENWKKSNLGSTVFKIIIYMYITWRPDHCDQYYINLTDLHNSCSTGFYSTDNNTVLCIVRSYSIRL